jgi:hypothetical protein
MTDEQKEQIDKMIQIEMCKLWRFAPSGHPLLSDDAGIYFKERLHKLGGFTPEISKELGWK